MEQAKPEMGDEETAFAKINLALHVRKRLPNGYHQLETVFAFLDVGDKISVERAEETSLLITGPFGEGLSCTDNLVLDAVQLFKDHLKNEFTVKLRLDKQLPVASGIGGGSADAAATLRLLNRFWSGGLSTSQLAELSAPLGADVPACLLSKTCRGDGIGQNLSEIKTDNLADFWVVLVNPKKPVSTALIFKNWNGEDGGELMGSDALAIAKHSRNDLTEAAKTLVPEIGAILDVLEETNAVISRMSGSGATCFGLFETRSLAIEAQDHLTKLIPEAWTMIGKIR